MSEINMGIGFGEDERERLRSEIMHIEIDSVARERFIADPKRYLSDEGIADPECMLMGRKSFFSEIVSAADEIARIPVARTVAEHAVCYETKMEEGDGDGGGVPTPYAPTFNALAVANALAFFNGIYLANANYWYNANFEGYAPYGAECSSRYMKVDLSEKYTSSEMCQSLSSDGYGLARQGALIKSMAIPVLEEGTVGDSFDLEYSYGSECYTLRIERSFDVIRVSNVS